MSELAAIDVGTFFEDAEHQFDGQHPNADSAAGHLALAGACQPVEAHVVPVALVADEGAPYDQGETSLDRSPDEHIADDTLANMDEEAVAIDTIRTYYSEIGEVDLLNAEQEVDLAKRIEAGLYAGEKLRLAELEGAEQLDPQYRQELLTISIDGKKAKEHLISANLRLVVFVAKRYQGRGMPLQDLIQEGNVGLIRAVEKFDYTKGYKFATYAPWWIRQAITRALPAQSAKIRVPAHTSEVINKALRVRRDLTSELGREPSIIELSNKLKMPTAKVEELLGFDRTINTLSLEKPIDNNGEEKMTLQDVVADRADSVEHAVTEIAALGDAIKSELSNYSADAQAVMILYFGLEGPAHSLQEVAAIMGKSVKRIQQIKADTLCKLRNDAGALKSWQ